MTDTPSLPPVAGVLGAARTRGQVGLTERSHGLDNTGDGRAEYFAFQWR